MMEGRGDGVIESSSATGFPPSSGTNPIAQLQVGLKDLENKYRNWVTEQSLPVEADLTTFTNAIQGAAIGGLMGMTKHSIYRSVALVEMVDKKDPRQAKGKAKRGP
ncbi:hypothetical protein GIB67_016520 [Kingdonia uniflora]|uniref:Uncharacterized protein n=1 Tax=Kingdonia uniflora TaxID=39325 RepID=A0A7J7NQM6_9MAGN|nr:hypothetical protein GIB67_016520 [Kingdonia uniflora]